MELGCAHGKGSRASLLSIPPGLGTAGPPASLKIPPDSLLGIAAHGDSAPGRWGRWQTRVCVERHRKEQPEEPKPILEP